MSLPPPEIIELRTEHAALTAALPVATDFLKSAEHACAAANLRLAAIKARLAAISPQLRSHK